MNVNKAGTSLGITDKNECALSIGDDDDEKTSVSRIYNY